MKATLEIVTLCVGPLEENTYLLGGAGTEALVIDPGGETERILEESKRRGWTIGWIAVTHGHADHMAGVGPLQRATKARIAAPEADALLLRDPVLSGAEWLGMEFEPVIPDHPLVENEEWEAAGRTWKIIHAPGHTPGHVVFYSAEEGVLVSGDVLFAGSVGRTDLPGGSWDQLSATLREKIFRLPDDTRVLPGHGPETTLKREQRENWLVRRALEEDVPGLADIPFP